MTQARKQMTAIAALIALGCTMLVISFASGLIAQENRISSTDDFSDSFVFPIFANKTFEHTTETRIIMNIEASANGTFATNVLYNGVLAFTPLELPGVKRTYDLFDPGNWTVRFS